MKNAAARVAAFMAAAILSLSFFATVYAVGGLESVLSAEDCGQMEAAIRETPELSDIAQKLDGLDKWEKAAVLDCMFRRLRYIGSISGFKALFNKQYLEKTTYMNWAPGYPYITDVGDNGACLTVKTDIAGWVYITSISDDITGGLTDEYSFMKFYNEDNGAYKKRVWVPGDKEKKIPVSCGAWASGSTYRTYYCLRTGGNESGFGRADYTIPAFWY